MTNKGGKHIGLEERKAIEEYIKIKMTTANIAKMLDRSRYTVVDEIQRNGGRQIYTALAAQERCEQKKRIMVGNSFFKKHQNKVTDLQEKFESIDMQIQILFDAIEELRNKNA